LNFAEEEIGDPERAKRVEGPQAFPSSITGEEKSTIIGRLIGLL
jgi:hypothetical protein